MTEIAVPRGFQSPVDRFKAKITAVDFEAIQLPACCYSLPALYISSKWFNYFGVLTGIAFDWGYWYMTALPFRPCDYGMLWDKSNNLMYMLAKP